MNTLAEWTQLGGEDVYRYFATTNLKRKMNAFQEILSGILPLQFKTVR